MSREFSAEVESSLRTNFPNTTSGGGVGTPAASARGIKSVDVAFTIAGLFLGVGVSIKTVGLPEGSRGYGHNFKRLTEEWTTETILYHRYMPVSIIVGILFCRGTRYVTAQRHPPSTTPSRSSADFREGPPPATTSSCSKRSTLVSEDSGEAHFVDVAQHLKPLEVPTGAKALTFEQVKDDMVRLFRQRNPKLRVKGMPEVDDSGAVTAASPALDEAFSDD